MREKWGMSQGGGGERQRNYRNCQEKVQRRAKRRVGEDADKGQRRYREGSKKVQIRVREEAEKGQEIKVQKRVRECAEK